jgi:hypothetical protein
MEAPGSAETAAVGTYVEQSVTAAPIGSGRFLAAFAIVVFFLYGAAALGLYKFLVLIL